MRLSGFGMLAVMVAALVGGGAQLRAATAGESTGVSEPGNVLELRQYKIENARLPGTSIRQNMMVWQVNQGMWKGQVLDGLSLVVVEQASADGTGGRTFAAYVSHFASPLQREALLAAVGEAHPNMAALKDISGLRVEPAVISVEIDGQTVVLHLALIA